MKNVIRSNSRVVPIESRLQSKNWVDRTTETGAAYNLSWSLHWVYRACVMAMIEIAKNTKSQLNVVDFTKYSCSPIGQRLLHCGRYSINSDIYCSKSLDLSHIAIIGLSHRAEESQFRSSANACSPLCYSIEIDCNANDRIKIAGSQRIFSKYSHNPYVHRCLTVTAKFTTRIHAHIHMHAKRNMHIYVFNVFAAVIFHPNNDVRPTSHLSKQSKMATVVGSSFRFRAKLFNFTQFGRCYSTSRSSNRSIRENAKYWCLFGGGLLAVSYVKWAEYQTVHAFNPKKIKVSSITELYKHEWEKNVKWNCLEEYLVSCALPNEYCTMYIYRYI